MALLIGTPAYNGMVHLDHEKTMIEAAVSGVQYMLYGIGNESLITRARNTIASYFYHHKEFDKLLFVDADIYVSGQDIKKLYNYNKDIVGAGVRLKSINNILNFNIGNDENGKPLAMDNLYEGTLLKVRWLGTAVIMFSRHVIELLVEEAKKEGAVYDGNSVLTGGDISINSDFEMYDLFRVGLTEKMKEEYRKTGKRGTYLSEDFWITEKCRELGIDTWVDTSILTVHNGMVSLNSFKEGV